MEISMLSVSINFILQFVHFQCLNFPDFSDNAVLYTTLSASAIYTVANIVVEVPRPLQNIIIIIIIITFIIVEVPRPLQSN